MKISEVMIIQHLAYIQKNCENIRGTSIKYISSYDNKDRPWIYNSLCEEVDNLIIEYNWLVSHINDLLDEVGFSFKLEEVKIIDANFEKIRGENTYPQIDRKLMHISMKCNRVLSILKNTATSTKDIKNKYDDLRKEIKELEKELPSIVIRDLYEAFEEFELNKSLGAVLICGRLIVFHLDKIKGNINEKVNELKNKGLLVEKGSSEFIFKADKGVRELFSHDLNYFPSPSETISLLGDTVKIVKIITSYQRKIEGEKTTGILAEVLKSAIK